MTDLIGVPRGIRILVAALKGQSTVAQPCAGRKFAPMRRRENLRPLALLCAALSRVIFGADSVRAFLFRAASA
jgi:hypothetical protein